MSALFEPVFTGSFTAAQYLLCTAAALVLGLAVALTARCQGPCTRSFLLALLLLPTVVQTVIMLVNGSIGTGLAVAGAFSLIRFRSAPGSAREILLVFLSMAVGLATAVGYVGIAVLFTVITGGVVMAVGSSGMAASFGPNSTQGVIATALEPQSGGRTLALCGEDGQVLAAFTPAKAYSHLVVSAPGIEDGGTYIICTGTLTGGDENGYAAEGTLADAAVLAEITMDGLNYGGMGGMFGGKGGGGRGGDFGGFGRDFQGGEKPEMPEDGERPEGPGGDQRRENGELPEMPGDGEMPLPEDPNIKGA